MTGGEWGVFSSFHRKGMATTGGPRKTALCTALLFITRKRRVFQEWSYHHRKISRTMTIANGQKYGGHFMVMKIGLIHYILQFLHPFQMSSA